PRIPFLDGLWETAMITWWPSAAARRVRSRCPRVKGSNEPGRTTVLMAPLSCAGLDASGEIDGAVVAAVLVDGADGQSAGEPGARSGARAGGDDVAQLGLAARHGAELLEGDGALAAVERALEELGGDVGGAARGRVAGGEHHALRGALERAGPGLRQVEAVGGAGEGLCGGQGDGEGRGAVIGAGAHVSSIRAASLRRTCSLASSAYCIPSSQRPLRCRVSS